VAGYRFVIGLKIGRNKDESAMSVLMNDPVILWSVIAGVTFLLALKVVAFFAVRRVMRKAPVAPSQDD
jgi:hypothetical protein